MNASSTLSNTLMISSTKNISNPSLLIASINPQFFDLQGSKTNVNIPLNESNVAQAAINAAAAATRRPRPFHKFEASNNQNTATQSGPMQVSGRKLSSGETPPPFSFSAPMPQAVVRPNPIHTRPDEQDERPMKIARTNSVPTGQPAGAPNHGVHLMRLPAPGMSLPSGLTPLGMAPHTPHLPHPPNAPFTSIGVLQPPPVQLPDPGTYRSGYSHFTPRFTPIISMPTALTPHTASQQISAFLGLPETPAGSSGGASASLVGPEPQGDSAHAPVPDFVPGAPSSSPRTGQNSNEADSLSRAIATPDVGASAVQDEESTAVLAPVSNITPASTGDALTAPGPNAASLPIMEANPASSAVPFSASVSSPGSVSTSAPTQIPTPGITADPISGVEMGPNTDRRLTRPTGSTVAQANAPPPGVPQVADPIISTAIGTGFADPVEPQCVSAESEMAPPSIDSEDAEGSNNSEKVVGIEAAMMESTPTEVAAAALRPGPSPSGRGRPRPNLRVPIVNPNREDVTPSGLNSVNTSNSAGDGVVGMPRFTNLVTNLVSPSGQWSGWMGGLGYRESGGPGLGISPSGQTPAPPPLTPFLNMDGTGLTPRGRATFQASHPFALPSPTNAGLLPITPRGMMGFETLLSAPPTAQAQDLRRATEQRGQSDGSENSKRPFS